jgi:hypothetical protein
MSFAIKTLGVHLKKEPLPLKKPLELLDEQRVRPYRVLSERKIDNPQIIKELGTEDYIEWVLEDAEVEPDSAVRLCSLFITYYDVADKRVTHVPDECYIGVGFQRLGMEGVKFTVNDNSGTRELAGRCVVFSAEDSAQWWGDVKFAVMYIFNVNGAYAGGREEARFMINKNIFSRYAYYSKVEWKFYNTRLGQTVYPSKQEAVAASSRLLSVFLPVLERDHWPAGPANASGGKRRKEKDTQVSNG